MRVKKNKRTYVKRKSKINTKLIENQSEQTSDELNTKIKIHWKYGKHTGKSGRGRGSRSRGR